MESKAKTLVLFDFDGTITTKETFLEFIKFTRGKFKYYLGFIVYLPLLIAYRMGVISMGKLKEKLLSFHFKGEEKERLFLSGKSFIEHLYAKQIIKQGFVDLINKYRREGADIAVVSASPEIWIMPFCERYGMVCVCTKMEFKSGYFTGKFTSPDCSYSEKKTRILASFNLSYYSNIIAYGDSEGDREMMDLANEKNWSRDLSIIFMYI
jgi:phosphatidylglycerophosphatase C